MTLLLVLSQFSRPSVTRYRTLGGLKVSDLSIYRVTILEVGSPR